MRPLLLLLLAAGCTTSRPVMAPDGSQGHYIECHRNQANCMDEAADLCPGGYHVLDRGDQSGALATYNQFTNQVYVAPTFKGSMTIVCRHRGPAANAEQLTCREGLRLYRDQRGTFGCVADANRAQARRDGLTEVGAGPPQLAAQTEGAPVPAVPAGPPRKFRSENGTVYVVQPESFDRARRAGWVEIGKEE